MYVERDREAGEARCWKMEVENTRSALIKTYRDDPADEGVGSGLSDEDT